MLRSRRYLVFAALLLIGGQCGATVPSYFCRKLVAEMNLPTKFSEKDFSNDTLLALVKAAQAGDVEARETLFQRLTAMVALQVVRTTPRLEAADAADVVQETLTEIFVGLDGFEPSRGEVLAWTYGIASNKARDFLRRKGARERIGKTNEIDPRAGGIADDTLNLIDRGRPPERWAEYDSYLAGLRPAARWALHGFSERDKEIVLTYFFDGKTLLEIGDQKGLSEGHVSRIVRRGRDRLNESLVPPPR